jgi:hypothetical protein
MIMSGHQGMGGGEWQPWVGPKISHLWVCLEVPVSICFLPTLGTPDDMGPFSVTCALTQPSLHNTCHSPW